MTKIKSNFSPVLVVAAVPFNGGIKFLHYASSIEIYDEEISKVWTLLKYCNGHNSILRISELSSLTEDEIIEMVAKMVELGLMVDSREQYRHFHRISSLPATYVYDSEPQEIATLEAKLAKPIKRGRVICFDKNNTERRNHFEYDGRMFSKSKKISGTQIGELCDYVYATRRMVGFGATGANPLKIYVLIERDQDGMKAGYYEYDPEFGNFVLYDDKVDEEQLKYCFNSENMPFNSSVQIVVAADFESQVLTYSNRGYRLVLMEAGGAAERICDYCARNQLDAQAVTGFLDEPLMMEMGLEDIFPLVVMAIGHNSIEYKGNDSDLLLMNTITADRINHIYADQWRAAAKMKYTHDMVTKENALFGFWSDGYSRDRDSFVVNSAFKNENGMMQYAAASSSSYADAAFKSVIEAYERWRSGCMRVDYYGPAVKLENWLDPRLIAPLDDEQIKKCNVKRFREDMEICWTLGKKYDGTDVYVPSDLVYYGHKMRGNCIFRHGHSSGIAAYSDFDEAQKKALVELIERDALMRNWYARRSPLIVAKDVLPRHVQKRMEYWHKKGREIMILEMPSDYGWAFVAVMVSEEFPSFMSGAAATIEKDSISGAICKALQELECMAIPCIRRQNAVEMDPHRVMTPFEHGSVYHFEKNAETLAWLWAGEETHKFAKIPQRSVAELMEMLQVVTVDISEDGSDLKVVRVLSPKLVPINFGFYSAHYTHPALSEVNPKSLEMPHYFA